MAPHHQHFFTFRLDLDVDGEANSATKMNTKSLQMEPDNPKGNAFVMAETPLASEKDAVRDLDMKQNRKRKIVNANQTKRNVRQW